VVLLGILAAAFLTGFSGAVMPGPVLAGVIAESARSRSLWPGPLVVLGHALLEFPLVLALAAGLSRVIQQAAVIGSIGLLGGAALVVMGATMLSSSMRGGAALPPELQTDSRSDGRRHLFRLPPHPRRSVVMGVVLSVANPYWTIWWATIGVLLIAQGRAAGALGLGAFYLGHISADLVWYSAVSTAVASGHRLLTGRVYHGLIALCAVSLVGLGLYFGWSGITTLGSQAVSR
jgi:threonine/homoserine/homoserine lactone efflux protein